MNHFIAPGGIDIGDSACQFNRFRLAVSILLRIDFRLRCDTVLGKKLLRFGTAVSARTVVTPVEFLHGRCRI